MDLIDAHRSGQITDKQLHQAANVRRQAHLTKHHCGMHVLVGLDADRCALTTRVDPYPLNAGGEVEALRDGRHTYLLEHGELHRRNHWNIPGHPPGPDRTVLAEHTCTELPNSWRRPPAPQRPTTPTSERAPF